MIERDNRTVFLVSLSALLFLAACAPPFSKELTATVDKRVTFKELRTDPEKFKGARVMLAGIIIASKNTNTGAFIEVLQTAMDSDGSPQPADTSEGRFLVQTGRFLDPAVYHSGRLLTVIGDVAGRKALQIDEIAYQYPLLDAKALHLWRPSSGPRFIFGVGVSGRM